MGSALWLLLFLGCFPLNVPGLPKELFYPLKPIACGAVFPDPSLSHLYSLSATSVDVLKLWSLMRTKFSSVASIFHLFLQAWDRALLIVFCSELLSCVYNTLNLLLLLSLVSLKLAGIF